MCVLTNAGTFPFTQVHAPLAPVLHDTGVDGTLLISPFSGAGMYTSDADRECMVGDAEYVRTAGTCFFNSTGIVPTAVQVRDER